MNIRSITSNNSLNSIMAPATQSGSGQNFRALMADMSQPSSRFAARTGNATSPSLTHSATCAPATTDGECETLRAFRFKLKVMQGFPINFEEEEYDKSSISALDELFMETLDEHYANLADRREGNVDESDYHKTETAYPAKEENA